jgi:mRNA interferase RelE/StbE
MAYQIQWLKRATRDLDRVPSKDRARLFEKISALANNARPPGSKKLRGREDQYRIRIGDYRVIYSIDDQTKGVTILVIGQRGGVYD